MPRYTGSSPVLTRVIRPPCDKPASRTGFSEVRALSPESEPSHSVREQTLDDRGIGIPFPQMDVHLHQQPAPNPPG